MNLLSACIFPTDVLGIFPALNVSYYENPPLKSILLPGEMGPESPVNFARYV